MKILVLGAAGMVGRKLIEKLLETGSLRGEEVSSIHAFDVVQPAFGDDRVTVQAGDITDAETVEAMVEEQPDIIFHLAAIVSGEAEADFEKGYRINLGGTNNLFDAIIAREGYTPRIVYASSIAVFGAPFPDVIDDEFHLTPLTSYGTQKAIGELLLADYTRKGHMDGVGIRLPTIVVRPGKPNAAASGFFSNIIREPLVGETANLPVDDDVMHWMASPRSAVHFCIHAAEIDGERVGSRRNLSMPGLAITTGEMVKALRNYAGDDVADRVTREPDATIRAIVDNWPQRFDTSRAEALGFKAESSFEALIAAHVEDELGGKIG
ncbi:MAG: D-erythronate dehydrogenase [Pseudomonadota bacterium]